MNKRTILITGGVLPASLGLVRLLGSAGHRIIIGSCVWWATGRRSRYVDSFHLLPSPRFEYDAFLSTIEALIRDEEIDLIIPCFEEIFYLAKAVETLGRDDLLFADSLEFLQTLHDKYAFMECLAQHGLNHPKSHRITNKQELLRLSEAGQGWVLKPVHSRFSQQIFFDPEPGDIEPLDVSESHPWVLQQRIIGRQICTYSVVHHGVISGHVAYTSLLARGAGAGVACESLHHEACFQWVSEFVRKTAFHGQISFDFIEDEHGVPYVIECNPRATTGAFFLSYEPDAAKLFLASGKALVNARPGTKIINKTIAKLMRWENRGDKVERRRIQQISTQCNDYYASRADPRPRLWRLLCIPSILREARRKNMDIETLTTYRSIYDGAAL